MGEVWQAKRGRRVGFGLVWGGLENGSGVLAYASGWYLGGEKFRPGLWVPGEIEVAV